MDATVIPRPAIRNVDPNTEDGRRLRDAARRTIAEHRASTPGRYELIRRIVADRTDLMRRLADLSGAGLAM